MKKRIILILTIVISLVMTSCTTDASIKEPEQTNGELNLFVHQLDNRMMSGYEYAIARFKELYPDVKVNVELSLESKAKDSQKNLFVKIMSGKSPDIIHIDESLMINADIYKLISNNYFTDLNPYLEADNDYRKEEYNQGIIKGGNIDGKQYIMPLFYSTPTILYDKILLEEKNANFNDKNFKSFLEELVKINKEDKNIQLVSENYFGFGMYPFDWYSFYSGIKNFNYKNKTSEFKEESKDIADMTKVLFNNFKNNDTNPNSYLANIKNKNLLLISFLNINMNTNIFPQSAIINNFSEPNFEFISDINNEVVGSVKVAAGIYNGSKNKQNAYNFIKILLDDRYQFDSSLYAPPSFMHIPVKNTQIKEKYKFYSNNLGNYSFQKKLLDQEFYDRFYEESQKITDAVFMTPWDAKYYEIMLPYFKGEKTYEECFDLVKAQARIYINE